MAYCGGSVGSPIVISDDDEDAAFVDQQLQFREQRNTSSTSSQESQPTQRGDEQWKGSWERDLYSSSSRDGYVGGYSLDRVPVWNRHGTVDKQADYPERSSAGKKRKRGELLQPQPVAPPAKKQKKKKKKQMQPPEARPQVQSANSIVFNGPSFSTAAPMSEQWPGAVFNSYEAALGLGHILANSSLAPLLSQGTDFHAQAQLAFSPISYSDGYFPPMYPSMYQQPRMEAPSLPAGPTYYPPPAPAPPLVPSSFRDGMASMGKFDTPILSGANNMSLPPRTESSLKSHFEEPRTSSATAPSTSRPAPSTSKASIPPTKMVHNTVSHTPSSPVENPSLPTTQAPPASAFVLSSDQPPHNPIGMMTDPDPTNTHGLFKNSRDRRIKTACALVMEAVPRIYRNDAFVKSWSQRAAGIVPCYHSIDDKGKVLMVFQSPELARKAFDSPRLTGGKGKEGIRVWWYRDSQTTSGAKTTKSSKKVVTPGKRPAVPRVAVDLEEGEIEETISNVRTLNKPLPNKPRAAQKIIESARAQPVSKAARKGEKTVQEAQREMHSSSSARPAEVSVSNMDAVQLNGLPPRLKASPALHDSPVVPMMQAGSSKGAAIAEVLSKVRPENSETIAWSYPTPSVHAEGSQNGFAGPIRKASEAFKYVNASDINSIKSSKPVSPMERTLDTDMDEEAEDMDLESPTSLRLPIDLRDDNHGIGRQSSMTFATNKYISSEEPAPTIVPPISLPRKLSPSTLQYAHQHDPVRAPVPQLPPPCPQPPSPFITSISHRTANTQAFAHSPPVSTPTPPSDTPSEPRAMKFLPKGPRSLLARTKELEERLARSKTEMTRPIERKCLTPALEHLASPPSETVSPGSAASPVANVDKLAMEENLRRLVLHSRKNKVKAVAPKPTSQKETNKAEDSAASEPAIASIARFPPLTPLIIEPPISSADTSDEVSLVTARTASILPENTATIPNNASLDDLAESFINDAIQTVKASPPLQKPSPSAIKIELAAKQKKLEQHISETKMLMAKLNAASTKAEKDNILVILRERSRLMDDYMKTPSMSSSIGTAGQRDRRASTGQVLARRVSWPETSSNIVLMISDDEDEESM